MTNIHAEDLAAYLDEYLCVSTIKDYAPALNGLQVTNAGPIHRVAAAVDASLQTITAAGAAGANALLVHHGLFWSGLQRLQGRHYTRIKQLLAGDIAVYSSHLPLDAHGVHGNSRLLAHHLGLEPEGGFAWYEGTPCGVSGTSRMLTSALAEQVRAFSRSHGGEAVITPHASERLTTSWAICSGAGAGVETLREARARGIDTLIVGEGPHWTAVDAHEDGIVVMYGGHYATETLGVQSLARHIEERFGIPWIFIPAPTGL